MVSSVHGVWASRYEASVLGFLYFCAVVIRNNLGAASRHPANCTGMAALMGVPKAETGDTGYKQF